MTAQDTPLPTTTTPSRKLINSVDASTPLLPTSLPVSAPSTELYGYLLMALSTLGFSGMSLFAHIAESRYGFPAVSAVFMRAVIHTSIAILYVLFFLDVPQMLHRLSTRHKALLISRGVVGSLGMVCVFIGLQKLPVGDAISIFFASPVITMLLSAAFLGEPITWLDCVASGMSFGGILLIARPGTGEGTAIISSSERIIGCLAAFAGAWLASIAYVTVRTLGTRVHFMASVMSLAVASIFTSAALGGYMGPAALLANKEGSFNIILCALFAFMGQVCLNKGLQLCRAGPGVLMRNLDVPLAYVLGLLFLGEKPSWLSFAGSCLVVFATLMIGLRQIARS